MWGKLGEMGLAVNFYVFEKRKVVLGPITGVGR